jgi:Cu/Ag efflux protein CusF
MKRVVMVALVAVLVTAATALAQTQPSPTTRPGAPPSQQPAPKTAHEVEGTVKKIDAMAKTVEVSRLLGIMSTKLEVTSDTKIRSDGKDLSLADLQEGAKVKAAYESQAGKNVAKTIEVMGEEKREPAASPGTSPTGRPTPTTK